MQNRLCRLGFWSTEGAPARATAMGSVRPPVFAKTLQSADVWLSELCDALELDRTFAWRVLSTVLHKLRDRWCR